MVLIVSCRWRHVDWMDQQPGQKIGCSMCSRNNRCLASTHRVGVDPKTTAKKTQKLLFLTSRQRSFFLKQCHVVDNSVIVGSYGITKYEISHQFTAAWSHSKDTHYSPSLLLMIDQLWHGLPRLWEMFITCHNGWAWSLNYKVIKFILSEVKLLASTDIQSIAINDSHCPLCEMILFHLSACSTSFSEFGSSNPALQFACCPWRTFLSVRCCIRPILQQVRQEGPPTGWAVRNALCN